MEARGEIKTSGVTVVTSDAPSDYHLAPRAENPNLTPGSASAGAPPVSMAPAVAAGSGLAVKKKRGRPRKYGPDAAFLRKTPPSPKPISSTVPPVIDFSTGKRGKIRGVGSGMKAPSTVSNNSKLDIGEWVPCSVGGSFAPHMITVNAGEDVTMKVISFSQQGPRAVCILSAMGAISSVTLRHPDSSGGTLTYEGRFDILSLAGSFMASEDGGGTKNRSGGMSISLVSPDGRVVGGCVAGLMVAASPVQIVVGSFLAANEKPSKVIKEVCISSTHDQDAYPNPPGVQNQNQNQNPRNINQTDINVTPSG